MLLATLIIWSFDNIHNQNSLQAEYHTPRPICRPSASRDDILSHMSPVFMGPRTIDRRKMTANKTEDELTDRQLTLMLAVSWLGSVFNFFSFLS